MVCCTVAAFMLCVCCVVGCRQCNEESELNGSASICLMKALISRSNSSARFDSLSFACGVFTLHLINYDLLLAVYIVLC